MSELMIGRVRVGRKWLWGLLLLALCGCMARFDPDAMQPRAVIEAPSVYGRHTVGQTFISRRPGLSAIEVAWQAASDLPGPLILHLRSHPAGDELAQATLDPAQHQDQAMLRWDFSPVADSQDASFYFEIEAPEATADDPLRLYAADHDVYAPGSAYADGVSRVNDLTFRTYYTYGPTLLGRDALTGLARSWLLFPALALFWAPGALLLRLWPDSQRYDGWERAAFAFGLSLVLLPLSLLWITQLGGRLTPAIARIVFGGFGLAALVLIVWPEFRAEITNIKLQMARGEPELANFQVRRLLQHVCHQNWQLGLILLVGLIVRLLAVRDLAVPAWVDAVHHTLLARIIAEGGRIPATYAPYVPVETATYHFGFHACAAFFSWLSGGAMPQVVLWLGQLFNAAMALQVYAFARWLTKSRRAGQFAALFVALVGTMPAYYVSWGRYTQLTGLLILPIAVMLSVIAIERRDRRAALLSLLTLAGLIATHYRVFAFYVCFIAAWWSVSTLSALHAWRRHLAALGYSILLTALAMLLLMPWIGEAARHLWLKAMQQWGNAAPVTYWDFSWRYVSADFDRYLLTVGILGALVALFKRERFSAVLGLWIGALFVITNPSRFNLPGEGLINNVAMLITWFMLLAIWCGYLLHTVLESWLAALRLRWHPICRGVLAGFLFILSGASFSHQIKAVNPNNVLALAADREALAWIEEHMPPDSHFLINAQPWQVATYIGSDGGYWITPTTLRRTTPPPALYPLGSAETMLDVQVFARQVEANADRPVALAALLREARIDYVYIGTLGGVLDPQILKSSPDFKLCHRTERTYLFALSSSP